jgi:hypothetical protein
MTRLIKWKMDIDPRDLNHAQSTYGVNDMALLTNGELEEPFSMALEEGQILPDLLGEDAPISVNS